MEMSYVLQCQHGGACAGQTILPHLVEVKKSLFQVAHLINPFTSELSGHYQIKFFLVLNKLLLPNELLVS